MSTTRSVKHVQGSKCFRPTLNRPGLEAAPRRQDKPFRHSTPTQTLRTLPLCQAISQDDMLQAEKKWNAQIREGKVRNVTPKGAGNLIKEGWTILDVRPPREIKVAAIEDAVEVPLFVPDESLNPGSLIKQMSAFGMGGWWLGSTHMEANTNFLPDVLKKVPKDAKLIVVCQKGLRSLAACEQLSRAGYQTLAWINGGLDTAKPGELPSKDGKDLRLAGIGGLSAALGWTELQQEEQKGVGQNVGNILKAAAVILVLDLLVFGYEQVQYLTKN